MVEFVTMVTQATLSRHHGSSYATRRHFVFWHVRFHHKMAAGVGFSFVLSCTLPHVGVHMGCFGRARGRAHVLPLFNCSLYSALFGASPFCTNLFPYKVHCLIPIMHWSLVAWWPDAHHSHLVTQPVNQVTQPYQSGLRKTILMLLYLYYNYTEFNITVLFGCRLEILCFIIIVYK